MANRGSFTHKRGDPVFMIEYIYNTGDKSYRVVTSTSGLKSALKASDWHTGYAYQGAMMDVKVYVCPDPSWIEVPRADVGSILDIAAASNTEAIDEEIERIRALYGATPSTEPEVTK